MKPLINIIDKSDSTLLELILHNISLAWGVWILLPTASFYTSNIFKPLSYIAPEPFWGFSALIFGLLGIFFLLYGFKLFHYRKYLSFAGSLYWTFISIVSLINTPFFTSFPVYLGIGLAYMVCFLKVSKTKNLKRY